MKDILLLSVTANTDFYEKWSDIFSNKSIQNDIFRTIGWGLVKLLSWLCNACEDLLILANKAIGFIYSDNVVEFISQWRFIIIGVLIIALLIFGLTMIISRKQDRSKLLQNIAIAVCVLIGLSTLIPTLGNNTSSWSQTLLNVNISTSSETVIKGAVTDLYYLDSIDFSDDSVTAKNNISADRILNIDPTEDISSSDDVSNPDVFSYKLTNDKNGNSDIEEIDDSGFSWNNDTYYRYHIDYITIFITLFATAIVMIFTAFKVVKIIFDIIVHQILAVLMAAGDWASGQKLKEVIKSLFALFFSVFMCSVMMKLYFLFSSWTSINIDNAAARALLLIFAAFAVIDGPNIVEKLFGVDAGLSSTFRSVSTLFFASRGLSEIARSAGHFANSAIRSTAHTAGGIGGFFKGISNARKNAESSSADNKPGLSDAASKKNSNLNANDKSAQNNADLNKNQKAKDNPSAENSANQKDDNLNLTGNGINSSEAQNHLSDKENDSDKKSIANAAAAQTSNRKNNSLDYFGNKARNPHSIIGAGTRGYNNGSYIGEKIGNAAARRSAKREEKRNLKGDEK